MTQAPVLELVFRATVELAPRIDVGETPYGRRVSFPILGGVFEGPRIEGSVLPGGEDWLLILPGKGYRVHAEYKLQTDDGTVIHVVNVGNFFATAGRSTAFGFTTPTFEVPVGDHAWLNDGAYVGTLDATPEGDRLPVVRVAVYKAGLADDHV